MEEKFYPAMGEDPELLSIPVLIPPPIAVVKPRGRGRPRKSAVAAEAAVPVGVSGRTRARMAFV